VSRHTFSTNWKNMRNQVKLTTCSLSLLCLYSLLTTTTLQNLTSTVNAQTLNETTIAQVQPTQRQRVAILDFDFADTGGFNFANIFDGLSPAEGVSNLITNALVKDGSYSVIERSKIDEILQEQNLGASGRVDPATAAQIGRVLGVDAVVIGAITQFNIEENNSSNGVCLFGVCSAKQKSRAIVQINARLVSTTTAEILAAAQGKGEVDKKSKALNVGGIYHESKNADPETLLSAAAEVAVHEITNEIIAAASRVTTASSFIPTVNAVVADVTNNLVTINKGHEAGLKTGMKISIERVAKEIKDPETGQILRALTNPIGAIELTEVGQGYATGKITVGTGFKRGDMAKAGQ
jgi:curli biogenesis system outer membrane secretion channel CsgG